MPEDNRRPINGTGSKQDDKSTQPWRTEGLPPKPSPSGRSRWIVGAILLLGYLISFAVLTVQDQLNGPQAVSYTEFKKQVEAHKIAEIFARGDSIEGSLKNDSLSRGKPSANTNNSRLNVRPLP